MVWYEPHPPPFSNQKQSSPPTWCETRAQINISRHGITPDLLFTIQVSFQRFSHIRPLSAQSTFVGASLSATPAMSSVPHWATILLFIWSVDTAAVMFFSHARSWAEKGCLQCFHGCLSWNGLKTSQPGRVIQEEIVSSAPLRAAPWTSSCFRSTYRYRMRGRATYDYIQSAISRVTISTLSAAFEDLRAPGFQSNFMAHLALRLYCQMQLIHSAIPKPAPRLRSKTLLITKESLVRRR